MCSSDLIDGGDTPDLIMFPQNYEGRDVMSRLSVKLDRTVLTNNIDVTVDGGTVAGSELIGRFWNGLIRWATVDQPLLVAEQQRALLHERVMRHADSAAIWAEFEAAA